MAAFAYCTLGPKPKPFVSLGKCKATVPEIGVDVIDLRMALDKLAADAPEMATVVDLFYFGGLTLEEIAARLEINTMRAKFLRYKAVQILVYQLG